jgi:hypothetical protein
MHHSSAASTLCWQVCTEVPCLVVSSRMDNRTHGVRRTLGASMFFQVLFHTCCTGQQQFGSVTDWVLWCCCCVQVARPSLAMACMQRCQQRPQQRQPVVACTRASAASASVTTGNHLCASAKPAWQVRLYFGAEVGDPGGGGGVHVDAPLNGTVHTR